jgi:NitT/TauT family transport system ATP-binding protein
VAGFVPLVDCAVLVAAHERGFAAAEGIALDLVKEPSWASLRDHLSLGHVDCAHALAPLPVALTLGVGHVQVDCLAPFVLGRGGNAITVSRRLFDDLQASAGGALALDPVQTGRALSVALRRRASPPTLGVVFPFSNHNFDLRYWLAAAGVHPDRDVRLVAIPPSLMVDSMRAGLVDGFCVGEPWNSLAVAEGLGCIVATQSQLLPGAAEKVLALRAAALPDPERLTKLLRALDAAAAWVDDPAHHASLAGLLAQPRYLGVPPQLIENALRGHLALGFGTEWRDTDFMYFHRHAANVPSPTEGLWAYAQMVRWGQLAPSVGHERQAAAVFRPDLYSRCLPGAAATVRTAAPFDGVEFRAADVAAYLDGLEIRTRFARPPST